MFAEKKVELIELFYDLIYVYAISNLTKLLETSDGSLFADLGRYLILCLVILQGWLYLTNYVNRYGEWTPVEYLLTAVNMTATLYMANTISDDWQIVSSSFNLAMAFMLGCVLLMYLLQIFRKKKDPAAARNSAAILAFVLVLYLAAFLLSHCHIHQYVLPVDVAAVLAGAFLPFLLKGKFSEEIIHFPHLCERLELITIITFGECVVGITEYFDINQLSLSAVLVFACVLLLFGCYVLQIHRLCDHERPARALRMMFTHYLIVLSLNLITITFSYAHNSEAAKIYVTGFMTAALSVFYLSLYADSTYYYDAVQFEKKDALPAAAFLLIGILLMQVISEKTYAILFGTFIAAGGNFLLLLKKYRSLQKGGTS